MKSSKLESIKERAQQAISPNESPSVPDVLLLLDMIALAQSCFENLMDEFEELTKDEILEKLIETVGLLDTLDKP